MSGRPAVAAVVGAGRTGRALGRLLARAGVRVGAVSCRTAARAEEARAFVGAERAETSPTAAARGADLVLVCVPDGAIADVARELRAEPGAVVAHVAGALGSEALDAVAEAERGTLHPLRSFADSARAAESFAGTACAVEGSPRAVAVLTEVVRLLGGVPLPVRPGGKALYHAGAVFASNYVVAMMDAARDLLERAGVPTEQAAAALIALASGVMDNAGRNGIAAALTGPIERGDADTVRRHAEALREEAPGYSEAYAALGRLTAALAIRKGSLDAAAAGRVNVELGGGSAGFVVRPPGSRPTTRRRSAR